MRYARGKRAGLPVEVLVALVAARHGTSPAAVRDWPADDFAMCAALLGITGLVGFAGGDE